MALRGGSTMANQEHLDNLKQGVDVWNKWRDGHLHIRPDLSGADLNGADLSEANLGDAYFTRANLTGTDLVEADLSGANLSGAYLGDAYLTGANLTMADLSGAYLSGANLMNAALVETNFTEANLTHCFIYGISAWKLQLLGAKQNDLVITPDDEYEITVDNLEVAQFIYLLLNNEKIREVIDTITSKVVLILGRFTPGRKDVLDAIRDELRKRNYTPVLFDFEKPANRDITETVSILAHMARFVIADITEPKSIPQELQAIIPHLPSVPIVPLLQVLDGEYGMYEHFVSYPWVQPVYRYSDVDDLLHTIQERVIEPAEKRVRELAIEKAKRLERS